MVVASVYWTGRTIRGGSAASGSDTRWAGANRFEGRTRYFERAVETVNWTKAQLDTAHT
jgi:hypothetical protein